MQLLIILLLINGSLLCMEEDPDRVPHRKLSDTIVYLSHIETSPARMQSNERKPTDVAIINTGLSNRSRLISALITGGCSITAAVISALVTYYSKSC